MIWLDPWALLGVIGVALPLVIHMLGRGHTRVHRFPTLRFLDASRLLPARRTRVHDPLLLAVRCSIVALAAAALAQPLLLTPLRRRVLDRGLARAIVVDTSESMRRKTPSGVLAVDSARRVAASEAAHAQTSVTIETNDPANAVSPAAAWLERQGRRGELVLISDFQRGQIDPSDLASVPKAIGVAARRIPVIQGAAIQTIESINNVAVGASATRVEDQDGPIDGEWRAVGNTIGNMARSSAAVGNATRTMDSDGAVALLGRQTETAVIAATRTAASAVATPLPTDSARAVAIVFPKYADRARLRRSVSRRYTPWMVDLLADAERDSLGVTMSGVAVVNDQSRLVLFTSSEPGSLASVRLAASAGRATSIAAPSWERDPETLSSAERAALQRPARDPASQGRPLDGDGPSDARWLWIGALALMLIEFPLRRRHGAVATSRDEARARAA
ncbi:MAG TPA: BatA domain-containing protein [Gemmatimonadaceae bacterium]|jgi:hypothetical protein|nr:BatA domain-containing protein [Gemmatimonadaceae bacterium]